MAVRKTPLSKDWTEMKELITLSTEEKSFLEKGNRVCKGPEVGAWQGHSRTSQEASVGENEKESSRT